MRDDTDHQWQWGPVTETDRICLLNHSDRDENQFRLSGQCQCVEDQIKSLGPWQLLPSSGLYWFRMKKRSGGEVLK